MGRAWHRRNAAGLDHPREVALRLLERPDGERRLTNLRHLCELLQAAPADRGSPHALLHWFSARATDAHPSEDGQLRLESDRDLVHIVTMHGSKGLEYDVVFCPFLFDAQRRRDERDIEIDYHDEHGHLHIDFRPDIDQHDPAIAAARRRDADAEEIRLTYVALTRAVHRCVLVAGCYSAGGPADEQPGARAPSTVGSQRSLLNWLVAGDAFEHAAWSKATSRQLPSVDAIDAAWQALASRAIASLGSGHDADLAGSPPIGLRTLADASPARRSRPHSQATELAARTPPAHIDPGWRLASFSSLMASAGSARIATVPGVSPPRAGPAVEPDIGGTADHDVHVASLGTESASTRGRADIAPEAVARPPDFLDFPAAPRPAIASIICSSGPSWPTLRPGQPRSIPRSAVSAASSRASTCPGGDPPAGHAACPACRTAQGRAARRHHARAHPGCRSPGRTRFSSAGTAARRTLAE
ncbi:MAG: 3'-5' exonuclease [Burkholderiaceae bacterium]